MKGYKVTNRAANKTFGIASSSLKELRSKAINKFQIADETIIKFVLLDGTIVDNEEYFQTLPPQTLIVLAKLDEDVCAGVDIIYNALRAVNIEYLRAGEEVSQFFDENVKEKLRILSKSLNKVYGKDDKTLVSSRKDDPEWFQGLETTCNTKESYLNRRCRERIASYFYKAGSDLRKSCTNSSEKHKVEAILSKLKSKLSEVKYNGYYFDRSDKLRLCNEVGLFTCGGLWKNDRCYYIEKRKHQINPYRSRDNRIVFSTWNLDHRIEKSRTIIPCVLEALRSLILKFSNSFDFNYELLYSLLFTSENLRLVHIVCHDKSTHSTAIIKPEDLVVPLNGAKKPYTTA